MDWPASPYIFPLVVAAAGSALLAWFVLGRRPMPGAYPLAWLMGAVLVWSLCYALELSSTGLNAKIAWASVEYVGIVSAPVAWLAFALEYSSRGSRLTARRLVVLAIVPVITLLLTLTNDDHGLIWSKITLSSDSGVALLDLEYGMWFWVHATYSYALMAIGSLLLLGTGFRSPDLYRSQAIALVFGATIPWLFNALYLFGRSPVPGLDLTPFAFTVSGVMLAWALVRYRLLDLVPIAREVVIESMRDGVIALDRKARIVYLNPVARRVLGIPATEAIGRPATELIPGWYAGDNSEAPLAESPAAEIILDQGDGARVYEPVVSPLRDWRGQIHGHLLVLYDVTERRRAEEEGAQRGRERAARESAERESRYFAFLAEASRGLVASLDAETILTKTAQLAVPTLATLCIVDTLEDDGRVRRAAVAHADPTVEPHLHALHDAPPDLRDCTNPIAQVLHSGRTRVLAELPAWLVAALGDDATMAPSGQSPPAAAAVIVPMVAREHILGAVTFVSRNPERIASREYLSLVGEFVGRAALALDNSRLYQEAQEAVAARDLFLSVASHELRTPLTVLMGYSQLLLRSIQEGASFTDRDRRSIRLIHDQASRLRTLVDLLLDLSRIQAGRLTIERMPVDVGAMIRRIVESRRPALERHTLELIVPDEPLIIEGDELRLDQALQNLLDNAIKYSPNGGPITIRLERNDGRVIITVRDRGIGIPVEAIPHLFIPFYRAGNVGAHQIRGVGLGLVVVKEIVALHGGSIEVESIEGQETTFTVQLPLVELS